MLELLVVLALIGLLAAIAVPKLRVPAFATDVSKAARDIASELGRTRQQAIFTNRPADLSLDLEQLTMRAGERHAREIGGVRRMEVVTVAGNRLNGSEGAIRFYPDGSSDGAEVNLTGENGNTARITVNWLTGRIEIDE